MLMMCLVNTRIIPETKASESTLIQNPQVMFLPVTSLHLLAPSTHSSFVCLALQHYISRLPPGASEEALVTNGPKLWQHRGQAIRELYRSIADPKTVHNLTTITSILVFLTNEVSLLKGLCNITLMREHSFKASISQTGGHILTF